MWYLLWGQVNGRVDELDINISGAGDAELYASETIDARISGAGSLDYWGDPAEKTTNVSGVGSIDSRHD